MKTKNVLIVAVSIIGLGLVSPGPLLGQESLCEFRGDPQALAERPSPLDSVDIALGDTSAKLCYGRPSARGRTIVGGLDPFGSPWRMGANEPTTLHLPFPATVGGVDVPAGSYTLYAIPEEGEWTIVINGNTRRWGIPISPDVRAADIGSFQLPVERLDSPIDMLTFRSDGQGAGAELVFEFERTRLRIPIRRR